MEEGLGVPFSFYHSTKIMIKRGSSAKGEPADSLNFNQHDIG
jgi:hypothetical protein